jgi:hypothetical protein
MIPRSCVIRVDPGWRGGGGGAGWDGGRGAEPLGYVYGRGRVLGELGRAGAGSGITLFPFTGRCGRRVAGRHCDGGRTRRRG